MIQQIKHSLHFQRKSWSGLLVKYVRKRLLKILKNNKKIFDIPYINAQNIPRYYSELLDTFLFSQFYAIRISKTWLEPSHSSLLCSLQSYTLTRNGRTGEVLPSICVLI